jgi:thiamine biosynthesis protein ThiS
MNLFYLNGQKYGTWDNPTLFDLLQYFDYNTALLVVEYNSVILPKKEWSSVFISDKDKIEIVTIVGGG